MTASELQVIVRVLANQCYVRYWLHYNYPASPALMAISVLGEEDVSQLERELIGKGFSREEDDQFLLWTIAREDSASSGFDYEARL